MEISSKGTDTPHARLIVKDGGLDSPSMVTITALNKSDENLRAGFEAFLLKHYSDTLHAMLKVKRPRYRIF